MRRVRGIVALVAGLVLGAGPARAGDQTMILDRDIEVRLWTPWPESCFKGWAPVRVELSNRGEKRDVRLEARAYDWIERVVERRIELDAGERVEFELLLPLGGQYQNGYNVTVRSADDAAHFGMLGGLNDTSVRQVLLVSEREPAAGQLEAWSTQLSEREVTAAGSASLPTVTLPPGVTIGYSGGGSGTTPDIELAHTGFVGLARHWGAYTSLDLVVLDLEREAPGAAELAPLIAWVRSGGDLLVIGARAEAEARALPELAAWMEPRFRTVRDAGHEYRCGLGRLSIADTGSQVLDHAAWLHDLLADQGGTSFDAARWRGTGVLPVIPGLDMLPFRAFAVLLLVFALVIGPVNFFFIARKKRAVLLLLTIPAIAATATLLLLGYGILFQGLDVKTASISISVLDERAHRSSAIEYRQLFAGLAPAEGLAPGPGTLVHATTGSGMERQRYAVEAGQGLLLKGDYLPSRIPVVQVLATERAERARLVARLAGEELALDNNLGVELLELVVRAPDGRLFHLDTALPAGASAVLGAPRVADADDLLADLHRRAMPLAPDGAVYLPPGCYLAELRTNPFRDACGIEENELASKHVLFGVLPLEPEAWR